MTLRELSVIQRAVDAIADADVGFALELLEQLVDEARNREKQPECACLEWWAELEGAA